MKTPNTAASAEREALISDLRRYYDDCTPGRMDYALSDGLAFTLDKAIKALSAPPVEAGGVEPDEYGRALDGLRVIARLRSDRRRSEGVTVANWIVQAIAAHPAPDPAGLVEAHVYESAVKGRRAFREAYRRCLLVVQAAEALASKWTTHGQKVDSDDWFAAVSDVCEAAIQRNSDREKSREDLALAALTAAKGQGD